MSRLPVIVGFGGVNPAGRSSFHHAFKRLVYSALSEAEQNRTFTSLASLMGLIQAEGYGFHDRDGNKIDPQQIPAELKAKILKGTLLRRLGPQFFDADKTPYQKKLSLQGEISFVLPKRELPNHPPADWKIEALEGDLVRVTAPQGMEALVEDGRVSPVQTAGQLPDGFDPGAAYASRNHPRALQMTIYGASDALGSVGLSLEQLTGSVRPDQIGVYAGNAMGQLDDDGIGGYMKSPYLGKRTSSKQMPFSFSEMPGDFINAYILGSLGHTGASLGACATFHYNLDHAVKDIQSGKRRICLVGSSEAPLVPEVFEGYRVMSALAEDQQILKLDQAKGINYVDHTRACRPFGFNCGFTLAEASEFVLLMDDELALEMGAQIFGAVGEVFVNADGYKKSISAPGAGNYITIAKAAASVRAILGEDALRQRSFLHAHGTGTPQNRVTESHAFNEVAKAMGIAAWPLAAIKCYLGHSIGTAGGSQLAAALGTWETGILPGIFTLDQIADDVHQSNLSFSQTHRDIGKTTMDAALLNSKGFGGNNATAVILAPHIAEKMLTQKHGAKVMADFKNRQEKTKENAQLWDDANTKGETSPIYRFGEGVLEDNQIQISSASIHFEGYAQEVSLELSSPYPDMKL